jgi:hypothetical protein
VRIEKDFVGDGIYPIFGQLNFLTMTIKSNFLFVLIGNGGTGKTALQKLLIHKICGIGYDTLPVNRLLNISHPEIKRKYQNISFSNRSLQEKMGTYESIEKYFSDFFEDADIAFIASHLVVPDVIEIIRNGRQRFFNLYGIFWSNSIAVNPIENAAIAALDWNERLVINNPHLDDEGQMNKQLDAIADSIVSLIVNRTSVS